MTRLLCIFAFLCGLLPATTFAQGAEPTPAAGEPSSSPEYLLGPGDLVEVRVLGEEALSGKVRVSESGKVDYPVLGTVVLGGLSPHQAGEHLTELLAECCLREPDVVLFVAEYQSHTVEVLGSVGKPGPVVLNKPTRILEALALAGGTSDGAAQELRLLRADGSKRTIDLYSMLEEGRLEDNLVLNGGDVLFVPKALLVSVTGEVKKGSPLAWREGFTLVEAVAEAGGVTEHAAARRVQVVRNANGTQEVFRVNLKKILRGRGEPFVLMPGDIVSVPRSSF